MSYNYNQLLPTVVSAINNYGIDITIMRDNYNIEVGVKKYVDSESVYKIKGVLDNSKTSNKTGTQQYTDFMQYSVDGTLYFAYDPNIHILPGDYIIVHGVKYILDMPVNILEVNLLYQVTVKGVKDE
mgnify:FL=1|jgi:hypothetical protein